MHLPVGFAAVVATGVAALQEIATHLREVAERTPAMPTLWLAMRDVDGLAGRLASYDPSDWEQGFVTLIGGQDFAVLDALIAVGSVRDIEVPISRPQGRALLHLQQFLVAYDDGTFVNRDAAT